MNKLLEAGATVDARDLVRTREGPSPRQTPRLASLQVRVTLVLLFCSQTGPLCSGPAAEGTWTSSNSCLTGVPGSMPGTRGGHRLQGGPMLFLGLGHGLASLE